MPPPGAPPGGPPPGRPPAQQPVTTQPPAPAPAPAPAYVYQQPAPPPQPQQQMQQQAPPQQQQQAYGAPPPGAPPGYGAPPGAPPPGMPPQQQMQQQMQQPAAPPPAPAPAPAPAPPPKPSYDAAPVVGTLQALIQKCNAFNLPPMDKRKMEDVQKRVGGLEAKLASGEVSVAVFGSLSELCRALGGGDVQAALNVHVQITTSDWADNGQWLMGLKRLIEMVAKLQVRL